MMHNEPDFTDIRSIVACVSNMCFGHILEKHPTTLLNNEAYSESKYRFAVKKIE